MSTLRLYGPGNVDRLDPATADADSRQLVRLFSRQLLTYEPRRDLRDWQAVAPVPDVALAVPSTYNAGLGASHRSHVVHLRPGVLWDTSPPRPVTAHDFVRGFKRLANPLTRSPALTFFRSTIRGMTEFAGGFAACVPAASAGAEQVAAYQNAHEISGIFALDDESLVIELVRPSPDFVHMLALPCVSAAPVEYDAFLPGSPELVRNLRSNGPYRVTRYVPGKELRLEPNPVWDESADPVRRPAAAIEVAAEPVGAGEVALRLAEGRADLPFGLALRDATAASEDAAKLSWDLDPYLVLNAATGNPALSDVRVRRALAAAIDKTAVAALYRSVRIATSIVPPGNDGHRPDAGGPQGDPAAAAGLALTVVHERGDLQRQTVRACAAGLARAGVSIRPVELDRGAFDRLASEPATAPWDLMLHRRSAAWHYRNGRVFLEAMFATAAPGNLGGFSDAETDELIERALESAVEHPAAAVAAWHAVERRVLDQAPVVPLLFRAPAVPPRCSARVRDAFPVPALGYACDLTTIRFDGEPSRNGDARSLERRAVGVGAP